MRLLFTAFLLCIICFTACGKADGININAPEGGGEDITKPEEAAGAVHREQPKEAQAARAEEELLSKQKELYECSIEALEDMLSENRRLDEDSGWYQEEVSTIYMFSEAYDGVLQAGFEAGAAYPRASTASLSNSRKMRASRKISNFCEMSMALAGAPTLFPAVDILKITMVRASPFPAITATLTANSCCPGPRWRSASGN